MRWSHFRHGADIGVCGEGASLGEAFAAAALALTAIVTDPAAVRAKTAIDVACEAPTPELLLVDFLNVLIFEMATRNMLFARYAVECDGHRLHGRAWGEPVDPLRHAPAVEPKGATYTALAVARTASGGWRAACVVDV